MNAKIRRMYEEARTADLEKLRWNSYRLWFSWPWHQGGGASHADTITSLREQIKARRKLQADLHGGATSEQWAARCKAEMLGEGL